MQKPAEIGKVVLWVSAGINLITAVFFLATAKNQPNRVRVGWISLLYTALFGGLTFIKGKQTRLALIIGLAALNSNVGITVFVMVREKITSVPARILLVARFVLIGVLVQAIVRTADKA